MTVKELYDMLSTYQEMKVIMVPSVEHEEGAVIYEKGTNEPHMYSDMEVIEISAQDNIIEVLV